MTWKELAEKNYATARFLFGANDSTFERAVCGRAYYAAYALVTARLPRATRFPRGWNNPSHATLARQVESIAGLHEYDRRLLRAALRRLRLRRQDSDYRPGVTVDRGMAWQSLRDADKIFSILAKR